MSIGLMEGWQHFEGDERGEHPLLDARQWCEMLGQTGFQESNSLPRDDSPGASIGQHVILARRPCAVGVTASHARPSARQAAPAHNAPAEMSAQPSAFLADTHHHSPEELAEQIGLIVRETICRIFHLEVPPQALGDRDRLTDLGMDSLIALELRGELARALGLEGRISSTIAFDTGTVGELTRSLITSLELAADKPVSRTDGPSQAPQMRAAVSADSLREMTEEQVEAMLKERLSRR